MRLVEMEVRGLTLDPVTNVPIVILRDVDGKRILPIWIGLSEANAIALKLENVDPPRPMTHDLMKNILETLGVMVDRVVVTDLQDNTYYAVLHLIVNGSTKLEVDTRPSDAIALALRVGVPLFVNEEVLARTSGENRLDDFGDEDNLKEWLENLRPEDFGNYTQ